MRPRYQLVTLIVHERQEHAHPIPLVQLLPVLLPDLIPSLPLHILSEIRRVVPLPTLCRFALPVTPPREIAMPAQGILFLSWVRPQERMPQHHLFACHAVAPFGAESEKLVRPVKLGEDGLLEYRMRDPA